MSKSKTISCIKCDYDCLSTNDNHTKVLSSTIRTIYWSPTKLSITFICNSCDEEQEVDLENDTPSIIIAPPGKGFNLSRRNND